MKRISTNTAVQNRFVDGNKATGTKATQFSAEWCNQIQEELANLLVGNGVQLGDSEHQIKDLFAKFFTEGFSSFKLSNSAGNEYIEINLDNGHPRVFLYNSGNSIIITPISISKTSAGGNGFSIEDSLIRLKKSNDNAVIEYNGTGFVFDKSVILDGPGATRTTSSNGFTYASRCSMQRHNCTQSGYGYGILRRLGEKGNGTARNYA